MYTSVIAILAGLFCVVCSYNDYDWFFNNSRASLFVRLFGREGARKFYIVLGIILIVLGVMIIPGIGL
ncbi:MAG: immunity 17 family protein [Ruminococcus sp.]|nr:immunity 17 family protein [Ruminococcus sp.]